MSIREWKEMVLIPSKSKNKPRPKRLHVSARCDTEVQN